MAKTSKPHGDEVTIGLIQMSMGSDPEANLGKALKRIKEAASRGAQVICLPELFKSQYFCQEEDNENFNLAETIPGNTTNAISRAAKESDATVIAGIFEKRARGLYHNSSVVVDSSGKFGPRAKAPTPRHPFGKTSRPAASRKRSDCTRRRTVVG